MTNVTPGVYFLVAEKNGYVASRKSRLIVTVTAGTDVRNIVLRLAPAAAISGRVYNEDSEPVPYVNVEVLLRRVSLRGQRTFLAGSAQTNDLGEYRIFGLVPGRYLVRATISGPSNFTGYRISSESDGTYAPVYFPDVVSMDAATLYEVRAGTENRADFHLVRVAGVTVRGRVTGLPKSEQPVRANVRLHSESRMESASVEEDGSFEIPRIAPGTYSLDASASEPSAPGSERKMRSAHRRLTVTPGGPEVVVNLQLEVPSEVHGKVFFEGGPPKLENMALYLVPADPVDDDEEIVTVTRSASLGSIQSDGTFKVVVDGRAPFRVALQARAGVLDAYYLKTVLYGGRDVTDSGFALTGGAATLEITVSSAGAIVEGSVVDESGKPVSNATVVAIPSEKLRERLDLYRSTTSDQNGRFVIRDQRPGDYSVFAWEELGFEEYYDPEFVKRYESKAQSLHAEANGRHQLALKVLPGDED